jgi:hypothetical protein
VHEVVAQFPHLKTSAVIDCCPECSVCGTVPVAAVNATVVRCELQARCGIGVVFKQHDLGGYRRVFILKLQRSGGRCSKRGQRGRSSQEGSLPESTERVAELAHRWGRWAQQQATRRPRHGCAYIVEEVRRKCRARQFLGVEPELKN